MKKTLGVLILAAGMGKRMKSTLPKVLHPVMGRPMLVRILEKVFQSCPDASIGIVVGHGRELVMECVKSFFPQAKISFIIQESQKGTGHAALVAMESHWGHEIIKNKSQILVLPGDLPLIDTSLVSALIERASSNTVVNLLTTFLDNPTGYGRIKRKGKKVVKIVEQKDATEAEKKIKEVATSIYTFRSDFLAQAVKKIGNKNAQGEYYLTDLIEMAAKKNLKMETFIWSSPEDLRGVNDLWELLQAQKILSQKIIKKWAELGVRFENPDNVWIEETVTLNAGVTIASNVKLTGNTLIGEEVQIHGGVQIVDSQIGPKSILKQGTIILNSQIDESVQIGPYAHLRPDSKVGAFSKIGNFVELKKSIIGKETSIAHLSYLGDAEVGNRVNIGCGFITCNFDGRVINGSRKHKTIIEDDVFMGSDCQTVAPVKIGKGSFIASGSTITENVGPHDLAIARSRQVNKIGYAKKIGSKK